MRWRILLLACASLAYGILPHVQDLGLLFIRLSMTQIYFCQDACLANAYVPQVKAGIFSVSACSGDFQESGVKGIPFGAGAARLPDLPGVPQVHADRGFHVSAGRDLPHRVPAGGHA